MAALGSLVVSLTAQTAQFTSALEKASFQSKKNFDSMVSGAKMAGAAIGVALSSASFVRSIKSQIDLADEILKTSQKIGVQVEELQKLRYAADLSGVSSETLTRALSRISTEAVKGNDALKQLGVSVRDSNGSLKNSDQILVDVADKISKYSDGVSKTSVVSAIFGEKIAREMIPFLNLGAKGIAELTKEAEQLGFVISKETADAAERFNDNLTRLSRVQSGFAAQIAQKLLPALESFSDQLIEIAKNTNAAETVAKSILVVFQAVTVFGANVAFVFEQVGKAIGTLAFSAKALTSGEFSQAIEAWSKYSKDAEESRKKLDLFEKTIMGLSSAVLDASRNFNSGKPTLDDFTDGTDKVSDAIERLRKEYLALFLSKEQLVEIDLKALGANEGQIASAKSLASAIQSEISSREASRESTEKAVELAQRWIALVNETATPLEKLAEQEAEIARFRRELIDAGYTAIDVEERLDAVRKKAAQDYAIQQQGIRDSLYEGLLTEEEQIMQSLARKKAAILTETQITEEERQNLLIRLQDDFDKKQKERQDKVASDILKGSEDLFMGMANLAKAAGGESSKAYRALFAVSKGFAIADATIKLQQAIANASVSLPFPANLGAMATVGAQVGALISAISSTNFSGAYDKGGMIPSGKWGIVGEYGPEIVQGPASVTSRTDTAEMMKRQTNIRIVNAFDSQVISDYIGSDAGEEVVMNIVKRNQSAIRGLVAA